MEGRFNSYLHLSEQRNCTCGIPGTCVASYHGAPCHQIAVSTFIEHFLSRVRFRPFLTTAIHVDHGVPHVDILFEAELHHGGVDRHPQGQALDAGAGLEDEGEGELVGRNGVPEHEAVEMKSAGLGVRCLGKGSDERVEEKSVVKGATARGSLVIPVFGECDGGGVVNGVDVGGGGSELGEDERVVVEAKLEDEGVNSREGGERVARAEEHQAGLFGGASFRGVRREWDLELEA